MFSSSKSRIFVLANTNKQIARHFRASPVDKIVLLETAAWAIFAVLKEREVIRVHSIAKTHLRGTVLGASGICCNTLFFCFFFIIATKSINIHIVVNTYSKIKSQKVIQDI